MRLFIARPSAYRGVASCAVNVWAANDPPTHDLSSIAKDDNNSHNGGIDGSTLIVSAKRACGRLVCVRNGNGFGVGGPLVNCAKRTGPGPGCYQNPEGDDR